jgi:hypothetical protein
MERRVSIREVERGMDDWVIVMLVTHLKYVVGHDCSQIALFTTILHSSLA